MLMQTWLIAKLLTGVPFKKPERENHAKACMNKATELHAAPENVFCRKALSNGARHPNCTATWRGRTSRVLIATRGADGLQGIFLDGV